ncbi:MAG: hypothetical protein ABR499_07375 [Gemmatimonadaceae bacterium]
MMRLSRGSSGAVPHVEAGPRLRPMQIEGWRLLWQEYAGDRAAQADRRVWEAHRARVRPEIAALLGRFITGEIDVAALRATFDRRTKADWGAFGLQGTSGTMFLNALVKHAPDAAALDAAFRDTLPAPDDDREARARLAIFAAFLRELRAGVPVTGARVLHASHAAFFVSMWWHLQDPERWPLFHPTARRALETEEEVYVPCVDPVEDYLAFRAAFLTLAAALGAGPWALEHLCWWHLRREPRGDDSPLAGLASARRRARRMRQETARTPSGLQAVVREPAATYTPDPVHKAARDAPLSPVARHTHVQWLLASLGRRLGCRVWVAANDHAREWANERLGALSVERLPPLGLDPEAERLVALIDVVWLQGTNQVAAAFEVERTTSVHSGLLRMADLAALSPNLSFPLYVVAPRSRLERVRRELSRPTFQRMELHRRCGFFAEEELIDAAAGIARWAGGPGAIARLAEWVADVGRAD